MKSHYYSLVLVLFWTQTIHAQPAIDAKASKFLKSMATTLANAKTISFRADTSFDEMAENGQQLQFSNNASVTLQRPNKAMIDSMGDTANRLLVFDGKTVTLFDKKAKTYAVVPGKESIDATLDMLFEKYGYVQPLADLFFADPYKVLTENVTSGTYVGMHYVGKKKCHHLAFRQPRIDWQIWIDSGKDTLPLKVVITFKEAPGSPQYMAILSNWNLNPQKTAASFSFTPPAGVQRIEMIPIVENE